MKTCAIVDLFSAHDHIIPSHIEYLKKLGYQVTVFSPTPDFRSVTELLPGLEYDVVKLDADRYQGSKIQRLKSQIFGQFPLAEMLCDFDVVLLNTFRTELPVTSAISQRCSNVLAVMHTPRHGLRQRRYRGFLLDGHQGLVLSRAMGQEFDLTWLCPLTYAESRLLQNQPAEAEKVFCVPGTVRFTGRTYGALVRSVSNLKQQGIDNFVVKIVGRRDRKDWINFAKSIRKAGVERYFNFVSDVTHHRFLQEVQNSDFVLPLIDRTEDERSARHYASMITSSVFLAIGMGKNIVCEREFAVSYQLNDPAITHSGGRLEDGLLAALGESKASLGDRQRQLDLLREHLVSASTNNLDRAIRGLN